MAQIPENATPEAAEPQSPEALRQQALVLDRFENTVSPYRFRRYLKATASREEAVALYLWNVALSEALYPALNFFEVALRNALHDALTQTHSGGPRWFMDALLLRPHHQDQVAQALQTLRDQRKPVDPISPTQAAPLEPQRVVAELSLGFWVNLCSGPYVAAMFPRVVNKAFPRASRSAREHHHLYPRLKEQHDLRNRIFHHEPIYHWKDLAEKHARLYELLRWIEPDQLHFLQAIDRFESVHQAGPSAHQFNAEYAALAAIEAQKPRPVEAGS